MMGMYPVITDSEIILVISEVLMDSYLHREVLNVKGILLVYFISTLCTITIDTVVRM
jgi:hypothetical protein